ncbi:hypothetical protein QYM36_012121 [Artemia franciscana]|uniref:Aldose 1-epimerase n=1 Tax=Artemia franciscana TaxID=6661 RepID=A0AA88HU52_ARTSF|nr:hypothetical protein QYM36_012121 [Artemia franciscana]
MKKNIFGEVDSVLVYSYTISNKNGVELVVHTYGAAIQSLRLPGKNLNNDVILGFDTLEGYRGIPARNPYMGSTVGRFANRIKSAKFELDGKEYVLNKNNNENSLHGGLRGFDKVIWDAEILDDRTIKFFYMSRDGEEGYPGTLNVNVIFTLTDNDVVKITYNATSDALTPINLTNHSYFNLAGHKGGRKELHDHIATINASHYTPVDGQQIPTGEIRPVGDSIFNLKQPTRISSVIDKVEGGGYDHNFVLDGERGRLRLCGRFEHQKSGRAMTVYTTQPGVQFYTGNFLPNDDTLKGKDGAIYSKHGGFCFETQNFPDAINQVK